MNTNEANRLILISGTATFASVFFGQVAPKDVGGKGEFPKAKIFMGSAVAYFGLSAMAEIAPEVAGGLAAAIMVTALTQYGLPLAFNVFTDEKYDTANKKFSGEQDSYDKDNPETVEQTLNSIFGSN